MYELEIKTEKNTQRQIFNKLFFVSRFLQPIGAAIQLQQPQLPHRTHCLRHPLQRQD
jgi:hypothetical protein